MSLVLGLDPGITHIGMSWYDSSKPEALFQNYSIKYWNGVMHELDFIHFGQCLVELYTSSTLRPLFMSTSYVGIERLPPKIRDPATGRIMETNRNVFALMCYAEQTIRMLYPHITIFYTMPGAVRAYIGSNGGKNHKENKLLSLKAGTLDPYHMEQYNKVFKENDGEVHADPMEAQHIAMYVVEFKDKLLSNLKYHQEGQRAFMKRELTASILLPKKKEAVKKRTKATIASTKKTKRTTA